MNKGESKEITIEANKTIEVIFGNKSPTRVIKIKKTGQKATTVTTTDSDYGKLHDIIFDYVPHFLLKIYLCSRILMVN